MMLFRCSDAHLVKTKQDEWRTVRAILAWGPNMRLHYHYSQEFE